MKNNYKKLALSLAVTIMSAPISTAYAEVISLEDKEIIKEDISENTTFEEKIISISESTKNKEAKVADLISLGKKVLISELKDEEKDILYQMISKEILDISNDYLYFVIMSDSENKINLKELNLFIDVLESVFNKNYVEINLNERFFINTQKELDIDKTLDKIRSIADNESNKKEISKDLLIKLNKKHINYIDEISYDFISNEIDKIKESVNEENTDEITKEITEINMLINESLMKESHRKNLLNKTSKLSEYVEKHAEGNIEEPSKPEEPGQIEEEDKSEEGDGENNEEQNETEKPINKEDLSKYIGQAKETSKKEGSIETLKEIQNIIEAVNKSQFTDEEKTHTKNVIQKYYLELAKKYYKYDESKNKTIKNSINEINSIKNNINEDSYIYDSNKDQMLEELNKIAEKEVEKYINKIENEVKNKKHNKAKDDIGEAKDIIEELKIEKEIKENSNKRLNKILRENERFNNEKDKEDKNNNKDKDKDDEKKDYRDLDNNIINFKNFYNVITVEYKDEIDLIHEFKDALKEEYGSRDYDDVDFKTRIDVNKDNIATFNKKGLIEIKARYQGSRKRDDIYLYSYVKEKRKEYSGIRDINLDKEKKIKDDEIYLLDYLEIDYKDKDYKKEAKDNKHEFLFISNENENSRMVSPINEKVKLEKNKKNELVILDVLEDEKYEISIELDKDIDKEDDKSNESNNQVNTNNEKTNNDVIQDVDINFTDIKDDYWAKNHIYKMVQKDIVKGYPDETFKPNNKVTIKEFLTMYGRALNHKNNVMPKNEETPTQFISNEWGADEVNSVLSRINKDKLGKIDTSNINRVATREEIAFIIANTLELNSVGVNSDLVDIKDSKYFQEINVLKEELIIDGYPDNTFKPLENISRAEATKIIDNIL